MTTFKNLFARIESAIAQIDPDLTMPDEPSESVRSFYRAEWGEALRDVPPKHRNAFIDSLPEEARALNQLYRAHAIANADSALPRQSTRESIFASKSKGSLLNALGGDDFKLSMDYLDDWCAANTVLLSQEGESRHETSDLAPPGWAQQPEQIGLDFGDTYVHPLMLECLEGGSWAWAHAGTHVTFGDASVRRRSFNVDIRVVGVGSAGCRVMERACQAIDGTRSIAVNTDREDLARCEASIHLQLGARITQGHGAGSNARVGRWVAEQKRDAIRELLVGADLVFVAAGLGGGTGSGAGPVIARIAREMRIATVAVVTTPFPHESSARFATARRSMKELRESAHAVMLVPNCAFPHQQRKRIERGEELDVVERTLSSAVRSVSELVRRPGMLDLDIAQVASTLVSHPGRAILGIGAGVGSNRAVHAIEEALDSGAPRQCSTADAKDLYVSVACDDSLTSEEMELIVTRIRAIAAPEADVRCGATFDRTLKGELCVAVLAAGLSHPPGAFQVSPRFKRPWLKGVDCV